jgi:quercetin dioxygenase-like cupin family protein
MAEYVKDVWSTEAREIMPGFRGHFVHSEHTTHVFWDADEGASVPEHAHPHEQIVSMLEGTLELVLAGTMHVLSAGDVLVIEGGQPHSATARTACKILDVFSPVREEYR